MFLRLLHDPLRIYFQPNHFSPQTSNFRAKFTVLYKELKIFSTVPYRVPQSPTVPFCKSPIAKSEKSPEFHAPIHPIRKKEKILQYSYP